VKILEDKVTLNGSQVLLLKGKKELSPKLELPDKII